MADSHTPHACGTCQGANEVGGIKSNSHMAGAPLIDTRDPEIWMHPVPLDRHSSSISPITAMARDRNDAVTSAGMCSNCRYGMAIRGFDSRVSRWVIRKFQ